MCVCIYYSTAYKPVTHWSWSKWTYIQGLNERKLLHNKINESAVAGSAMAHQDKTLRKVYNLLRITYGALSSIVKLGYGGRPNKKLTKTS